MRKVAFFGGTFDPVHVGHLKPAVCAADTFRFDALVFVPSGQPPHKLGEPLTPFAHRFAMVALATQSYDRFLVSEIEAERPGPTYTVDTLRVLRQEYPAEQHFFLMGSDSFAQIGTWHRWEELLDLANLVVLHRPTVWGADLAAEVPRGLPARMRTVPPLGPVPEPEDGSHAVYLLEHEPYAVAASELRERVRAGSPIRDEVPSQVERYIAKHGLYVRECGDAHGT